MSSNKTKFFILLIILSLSLSAPPPPQKPKPINEIIVDAPTIINLEKNQNSAFKRLDSNNNPTLQIENITSINTFYEDYKIEEHYMIIIPKDLPDGYIFTKWGINMGKNGIILEEFNCTCEILSKETGLVIPEIECITSFNLSKDESPIKLDYSFSLPNTALLKVNLKYKKNIDNEILYKTEWMYFPFILGFSFCNFTCVLSEGYKSLGLQNNILKKVSDNTYSFIGTNITETLYELIHFAPIKTLWKAKTEVYLYYPQKFTNKVWLTFPRYYRGGKLKNSFYKISSSLNDMYNEEDIIYQDLKLRVEIPATEHERVSAKVETGFINDLRNDFIVYIPESYYEINITDIPQEIKDITQEVIRNNSDLPAYYSIGKFVHSYITYDIKDLGKRYTAKQILENRKGVCEHYTILYNAMLNSIGIKAMYVSGWALQNAEISANDQTIGHAWTVALIDGKWIELDSTWGLFEGVPAGHIYKTLFTDSYFYSCYEHGNLYFGQNRTLQLYEDISDISDILTYETSITSTYKKIFSSTEEISSQSTSYTHDILTEDSENSDFIELTKTSEILSDKITNEIQKERTTDLLYDKTNIPNTEGNSTKIQETNNEITKEISTYLISDEIFDKTRDIKTNRESSDLNNDSIDISNRVTSKITKKELSDIISEGIEYSSSSNEGIIKSTQTNIQPVNSKISTTDNLVIDSFSNTPLNTIINNSTTYPINSSVTNTIQTSDIIKTQTKIPLTTSSSYTKSTSSINNLETSISINSIPKSSLVTTEPSKNGTHIITTTFPETSIVNPDTTIQKNIKQSTQIIIPETKFNRKTTLETSLTNSPSTNSLTFSTNNPKISNIDTTTSYTTIEKDITSTTNTTQITFPKSIHTDFTKTTNIAITKTNPTTTPWTYPSSTSSTKNPKTTLTTEQFTSSKIIQKTSNLSYLQTTPIIEKETGLTNKINFSTNVNNHIDETIIETIPKSTKITNIEETPVINSPTTTIPKNIPTSIPRTTDETFSKNMLTTIYEKSDINTQESTINNLEKNITTTFAIIPTKPSETIIVSIPKNSTETKSTYLETISKITQAPSQETLDTKSPTSNIKTNPSPFPSTIPETIPKSNPEITTPIANSTLTVIPSIKTLPEISQSTIPKTIPKTFSTTTPSIPPKEIQTTIPLIMPTTIPKTIPHSNENIDKANIILSFRQIQNFTQNKNDNNITFYFYGLTTESKSKIPNSININVNLIKKNGEREDNIKTSFCELKDIKNNIYSSQAKYICTISKLKEKYHSLRYNSSTYIFGIPENEISLDPYMTQKYIKENKIEDATKVGIPTTFVIKSINHDTCKTNGIFTISGDISEEITQSIIFNIPLSETKDVMSSCNLTKNKIECKVDREINNNKISIEQMIIKENYKEILFISSAITKDKITCKNALYEDSTKKKDINISFRQISHLAKFTNGFSFYLITLISSSYNKDYKINIKMNVYINKIKNEKNAICILENDAKSNGGLVQGNFKCTVSLSNDEYKNIDFTTITISNNNEDISGISDLDEITSNPYKTDEFIKEIKDKKSKGQKINELTDIIDYYSEKSNIIPILDIQSININDCHNKGKLYIIGKLSENINKKIKFDLPLTYPTEEIKCELDETKKNSRVTITCKSQNKFDNFDTIIIEPRLIKKKNQEIIFIKGKEVKFEGKKTCENYNTIKMHTTKKKQESKYTFLQLNNFIPKPKGLNFFMALIKNDIKSGFNEIFALDVKITIIKSRFLRNLDEIEKSSVPVSCKLNQTLKTDLAAGYNCENTKEISGTPSGMEIETDDLNDISGIPENGNPDKLKTKIDYTNIINLKKINDLPVISIIDINGDKCAENGQYIITAEFTENKNNNLKNEYENVEIRFSIPESSGLCHIEIDDKIIMTCANKEKFDVSQILIERNIAQDKEGNDIFIINSITSLELFGCGISYDSAPAPEKSNNETEPEINTDKHIYERKKNKTGLSGGAIAMIVIISIIVIGIIILVICIKNKKLLCKKNNSNNNNKIPTEPSNMKFANSGNVFNP